MNPTDPTARLCDLMRQGFMKPRRPARTPKPLPPMGRCYGCLNWHRKGKHVESKETRKRNLGTQRPEWEAL